MTAMHQSEPFTYEDLASFPDDGYRRELVGGQLLVSPAPNTMHQHCRFRLAFLLMQAVPSGLTVSGAPVDLQLSRTTVLQPDLLVVESDQVGSSSFTRPPLLVVEVLSPSNRRTDLTLKRSLYETHGVPSCWFVDVDEPSLTVLELEDGGYVERVAVQGEESWTAERPFPVTLVPAALVHV